MENIIILESNIIDLSIISTSARMLIELDSIIQKSDFKGKSFKVNLGDVTFNPAHMNTLKSIMELAGAEIELIITKSVNTQLAALETGLAVSEKLPEKPYQINIEKKQESVAIEENQELELSETTDEEVQDNIELTNKEEIIEEITEESLFPEESNDTEKALEDFLNSEEYPNNNQDKQDKNEKLLKKKAQNQLEKTLYINQTLRSGRTVNFDGHVFIVGDCHPGSEISATGDINVWGVLSGIAHAGTDGNQNASIRALKINAIQLRIANMFSRKPDRLLAEKVEKTNTFTPEEAKIENGEIKIFSYKY